VNGENIHVRMPARRGSGVRIALVAHDAMKESILDWGGKLR
jgi:hypothetical protein